MNKRFKFLGLLSVLFVAFCSTPTLTAEPVGRDSVEPTLFRAGEIQIDLNGTARTEDLTDLKKANLGAGVGVNYFPWRAAGFGAELSGEGTQGILIDQAAFALIGRLPIDKLRLAPEFKLGTSYAIHPEDFAIFAAIGLELRLTRNIGLGAELRGTRPIAGAEGEDITGIIRARLNF